MVHWWWLIPTFVAGAYFGLMVMAILAHDPNDGREPTYDGKD